MTFFDSRQMSAPHPERRAERRRLEAGPRLSGGRTAELTAIFGGLPHPRPTGCNREVFERIQTFTID